MLIATREVVATLGHGAGEAGRRRVSEAAAVRRPAEAAVEVQLRPVLVLVVDLAAGLEHHGAARVAVEVGDCELRAGTEESTSSGGEANKGSEDDGGDDRGLHFDVVFDCFWRRSI